LVTTRGSLSTRRSRRFQPALALQPAEAEVVLVLPFYRILQTLE